MSTLRRLFSVQSLGSPGSLVWLDARESHHGHDVLRLRPGDGVVVFDERGRQFEATVRERDKKRLVVVLGEPLPGAPEVPVSIALYLALAKAAAFDEVLQHSVELGVAEIVPFQAERSVPAIGSGRTLDRKMDRWRQIMLSATKQCGRVKLTTLAAPLSFDEAVGRPDAETLRLCCAATRGAPNVSDALRSLDLAPGRSVAVMIGPEGGLTDGEIERVRECGWQLASLGPRTLRVETAAAAALTLVLAAASDI
jgi:16S rRNA (uracil1498-N3)-methyltransferase